MSSLQTSTSPLKTLPSSVVVNHPAGVLNGVSSPVLVKAGLFEAPQSSDAAHSLRSVALSNDAFIPLQTATPLSISAPEGAVHSGGSFLEASLRLAAPTAVGVGVGGCTYLLLGSILLAAFPVVIAAFLGLYSATHSRILQPTLESLKNK